MDDKEKNITIALAGNPNVGKSVIFNTLTGGRQHVGNWPGKTVEKKEGWLDYKGYKIKVVDLPGIYSLTAYSIEELIARNYIVEERPDVVIQVIDSTNLERNLYLTLQLLELGAKVVLCLNMTDLAEKQGLEIDETGISCLLGTLVQKTVATKKLGIEELLKKAISISSRKISEKPKISYGKEIEEHLAELGDFISKTIPLPKEYLPRWIAIKLVEDDQEVFKKIKAIPEGNLVLEKAKKIRAHLKDVFGQTPETTLADARYGFLSGLIKECTKWERKRELTLSDKIDKVVLNRALGIPILLVVLWLVFQITFSLGAPLADLIDSFFGWLAETTNIWLSSWPGWITSLIGDGIIGGVGTVLVFIPNIFLLFLMIAILEDCGYLARAAFVMDRIMHKIGLHGKSFIPMILGFGCNVPAIMATRILESRQDRILTILINPLMSCSARLPIYVLFVGAFFPAWRGLVLLSLYLLGIILAILMGLLFKRLFFKGISPPFVMELPPYRLPTLKGILIHMWERGSVFLKKAGTIILLAVIIIWALGSLPPGVEYGSSQSIIGKIGHFIAPVFSPLGFGNWQAAVSLFFGVGAKEVVVGTLGTLLGVEEEALPEAIQHLFTPLSAYAFMVFSLIYIPCIASIAVIKRETNSWKWPAFAVFYTTGLAWIMSFLVYQVGLILGF